MPFHGSIFIYVFGYLVYNLYVSRSTTPPGSGSFAISNILRGVPGEINLAA